MELTFVLLFAFGYLLIIAEPWVKLNKSATALLLGVILWLFFLFTFGKPQAVDQLSHHLIEIAELLFFLFGAMTLVNLVDGHRGFDFLTEKIKTSNKKNLFWILTFIAFFLSAALDNLTTTILMLLLSRKFLTDSKDRWIFGGMTVIAANAGGVWSPIGDVTTTMLWVGGQISTFNIISQLFFPSLAVVLIAGFILSQQVSGTLSPGENETLSKDERSDRFWIFTIGIGGVLFVPVFKTLTGFPPYVGMLLALSVLWIFIEIKTRKHRTREDFRIMSAFEKLDIPSILFFLGILMAVGALDSAGILGQATVWLQNTVPKIELLPIFVGIISSAVDNIPLVAASIKMFPLDQFPQDSNFWNLLAFGAGTGGSLLIIGSAPGVVLMGMEKTTFGWFVKKISPAAFAGFAGGLTCYLIQTYLFTGKLF